MGYDYPAENETARERVKYITIKEYRMLLSSASKDIKAYTFFLVIGNLGLRVSEAQRIRVLDLLSSTILIHTSKQRADVVHEMPLTSYVHKQLLRWIRINGLKCDDRLFKWSYKTSRQMWNLYAGKVGLKVKGEKGHPGRGIHCLRHLMSVRLSEKKADPAVIKSILRHRNLSSTLPYLHSINSGVLMDNAGPIK